MQVSGTRSCGFYDNFAYIKHKQTYSVEKGFNFLLPEQEIGYLPEKYNQKLLQFYGKQQMVGARTIR